MSSRKSMVDACNKCRVPLYDLVDQYRVRLEIINAARKPMALRGNHELGTLCASCALDLKLSWTDTSDPQQSSMFTEDGELWTGQDWIR